jgi:iron complex transport system ATP-binding protein
MDKPLIQFKNVSFFYLQKDAPSDLKQLSEEDLNFIFQELDLDLPPGVLSVIGENGIGKSTLMLLAAGRLFPVSGRVEIMGNDTGRFREAREKPSLEAERNALASVVYQNMEFETEHSLGDMIGEVFAGGFHDSEDDWVISEGRRVFELESLLTRKFQELSKGEMQRALMAIAIAYGSSILFMDEPVFALEEHQKERSLEYLRDYSHRTKRSLLFSAHNIHLCRDYADNTLLMRKDGNFVLGSASDVCQKEVLEAAYQVPMDFLHRKESLYRDMLLKGGDQLGKN